MNPEKITDVVWLQTAFIGDIVLTTSVFRGLQRLYPHIRQHLITTPAGCEILKGHPSIAAFYAWNKKAGVKELRKVSQELRHNLPQSSSITIQIHKSFRSSLMSRSLGFPVITYEETVLPKKGATLVPRIAVFHECERVAILLEPLGIPRSRLLGWQPFLAPLPPSKAFLAKINTSREVIAIAPGSVWATKRWTIEGYRELIEKIQKLDRFDIALIGSKDEAAIVEKILEGLPHRQGIVNLVAKTSFDELRMLYPRLSGLVSGDSSPVHFAAAYGVPSVVIFGATIPEMGFSGRSPRTKVVEIKGLSCRPCSDHGPKACPLGHFKCMRSITAAMVLDALTSLMA